MNSGFSFYVFIAQWYTNGFVITLLVLLVTALLFVFLSTQRVPDGYCRVVERLGRRQRILKPGINAIIPIIENIRSNIELYTILDNGSDRVSLVAPNTKDISMAEQRIDPPEQKLLCYDNSEIFIDSVAYFKVVDPLKLVYDVAAFDQTFISLVETTLRQEVGKHDGDTIITSREVLSENLRAALQEASTAWGIRILRVEIEEIRFDNEIQEKLSAARSEELLRRAEVVAARARADQEVLVAEAEKKAEILKAEGTKLADIARAEGEKQAQILRAEATFEEQRLKAEADFLLESRKQEGQAQGYYAIVQALSDHGESVITLRALEAQEKVAESLGKSDNTLIIPSETAGLFGAVTAAIKGISAFTQDGEKKG